MLEKVLENKNFSVEIKNILLSMIYKIEMAYQDYKNVKVKVQNKDEFLNELIEKIDLYCDYIHTVKPFSEEAKTLEENEVLDLVNLNERSICAYPTEIALFSAISDIYPKYYYIDKKYEMRNLFQKMLVNGKHESDIEILKNFNGWSWNNTAPKKENVIDNLIYHNLLYLVGNQFLNHWEKEKKIVNYIEKLRNGLKRLYGEKLSNDIYIYMCRVLIGNSDGNSKEKLTKLYEQKSKQLEKLKDEAIVLELKEKSKHIEELQEKFFESKEETEEKKKSDYNENIMIEKEKSYSDTIEEKVDETLSDNDKKNEEELYQKKLQEKINELEEEVLIFLAAAQDNLEKDLEHLQIYFLKAYVQKIKKIKTREALISVIYEIRYYRNIYISHKKIINQSKKLKGQIDILNKILITKACKIGVMTIFSNDINLNFEIINFAIDSKIVELDEIEIVLNTKTKGKTIIEVFDKETFEKQKEIEIPMKDIMVKKNKPVKLVI